MDKGLVRIFETAGGRDCYLASDLGNAYSIIFHEPTN